nr:hypothetical protein [Paenibacillus periandrae]
MRTIGTAAFAIMSVLAGWLFARNIQDIFLVTSLFTLVGFFLSLKPFQF